MKRADQLRTLAILDAIAGELRRALKADAKAAFTQDEVSVNWAADGVTAAGSRTHDRVEIADQDELMCWLIEHHPDWVMTVVVPRNPEHLKTWLADLAKAGPHEGHLPEAPGGTAPVQGDIPGLVWVRGGCFKTLSVTVDGTAKRRLASVARAALAADATLALVPPMVRLVLEGREVPEA